MDYTPNAWSSGAPQEMVCSICSDKAEGYHFGAISCAACGAFFRRSVSDQKVYSCSNRRCNIEHDPMKRGGSCRFCRFLKCVSSGMLPQDVKAKRTAVTNPNQICLYRNMNQNSLLLIDQVMLFRRNVAAERLMFESTSRSTNRTNLIISIQQDFQIMRRIAMGCPFFIQIVENLRLHLGTLENKLLNDPISDIFLLLFVFEICFLTATKGGVQLDRLLLPTMEHVDLSEVLFSEFLEYEQHANNYPYRNVQNSFSFLVQMVSRTFQSANFDEPLLSILLYKCLTEAVPFNFRHTNAEVNRDSLMADLNRVDTSVFQRIQNISSQIHQGNRAFKEAISNFI